MHSNRPETKSKKSILPNAKVVSSLFESYLTIRKISWGIGEDLPIQLITSSNTASKITTCIELLEQFKSAKNFNDWINIIYLCASKENDEKVATENHWYSFFTKLFSDKPLLLLTIHAAIAYMLSQLMQNEEFSQLKSDLQKEITNLDNAIIEDNKLQVAQNIIEEKRVALNVAKDKLTALNMQEKYHHSYFLDIILPREEKANDLDERSFADYEQHVISGLRELTMCKTLLGYAANGQMQLSQADKRTETLPSSSSAPTNNTESDISTASVKAAAKKSALAMHSAFTKNTIDADNEKPATGASRYNLRSRNK